MALRRTVNRYSGCIWQHSLDNSFLQTRPQLRTTSSPAPSMRFQVPISSLGARLGSSRRPRSTPRVLPAAGFESVAHEQLVEEETMPEYRAEHFYPMRLGEVFCDRYQTLAKLGFGSSSTIWLARDLQEHRYVALKVYIHNSVEHRELPFYQHLEKALPSQHPGAKKIRKLLDSFQVDGPHGTHKVLVHEASQMSLRDMDIAFMKGKGFDEDFVKNAIKELLLALDFFHREAQCVHTDVHSGNLLLGSEDDAMFRQLEETEFKNPVPRKPLSDRAIYLSRLMKPAVGPLLLSDFGETRIGPGPHAGDIMPIMYRAPETLLYIQWSYAVDIWSVGLTAWDLLEGRTLFSARKEDGSFSDGVHFSELIAALGPPPQQLLDRNRGRALEYWDEHGNWGEFVPIPVEKTLEAAETKLQDKTLFLRFIRRALTWDPDARPTARELLQDPWLE